MRTLQLTCLGVVILALLVGMNGVVVAQDEVGPIDPMEAVAVTGRLTCGTQIQGQWDEETSDYVATYRGQVNTCIMSASDPRISGTYTGTWVGDGHGAVGTVFWGTEEWDGADGWRGSYRGYWPEEGTPHSLGIWEGFGANEGLTFVRHGILHTSFDGVIYTGPPPEWGSMPSSELAE